MPDTILDGSGEQTPGRRPLDGTDLEIAYNLLGDDLVVRVNKAGVHVFGVVLPSNGGGPDWFLISVPPLW